MTYLKNQYSPIDSYIASFPANMQILLQTIRKTIHEAAPDAHEAMAYGIPTFKLNGNLVHFAGYKKHIGFYPAPSAIETFKKELSVYETSKGTIKFPLENPLPLDLIKRMVKFRVKQQREK